MQRSLISVEEASVRLGISIRAVQKRLKKGTLAGAETRTIHGERWLVEIREQDANQFEMDNIRILAK